MAVSALLCQDFQGESNGYSVLTEGQEDQRSDAQTNEGCVHSSDDEDQEPKHQEDGIANESQVSAHDSSGSRPLLQDSEEEEPEESPHSTLPTQIFYQPPQNIMTQNHCQVTYGSSTEQDVTLDVFSKAPFRIADDTSDVFANAPFLRPVAQQPLDVFAQAPFGKRKESTGVSSTPAQTLYPHAAAAPEQGVFGSVAPQPFRPQALAKYSRHFEGSVPQQSTPAHKGVADVSRPVHSVTTVDPFVSAPFHFKAPQEKP